jgi:hypothetical protein
LRAASPVTLDPADPCGRNQARGAHANSKANDSTVTTIGIDIGKNSFHLLGLNARGAIVMRQKLPRGQVVVRLANMQPR